MNKLFNSLLSLIAALFAIIIPALGLIGSGLILISLIIIRSTSEHLQRESFIRLRWKQSSTAARRVSELSLSKLFCATRPRRRL